MTAVYIAHLPSNSVAERTPLVSPAAEKKGYFIAFCLSLKYKKLKILSPSIGTNKGFNKSKEEITAYGIIKHINDFSLTRSYPNFIRLFFMNIFMFGELMQLKSKSVVYIYHGPAVIPCLVLAQLIKRHIYTLQVEEIYHMNMNYNKYKRHLLHIAEALMFRVCRDFILASKPMKDKLPQNLSYQKICIAHGPYRNNLFGIERLRSNVVPKFILSGAIDDTRGAFFVVNASKRLFSRGGMSCEFHFTGTGKPDEIKRFESIIHSIEADYPYKKYVFYHGLLSEDQYNQLMCEMDYGLVYQDIDNSFSSYCFPSKIIQYLNFGLGVLCPRMISVLNSNVADLVTFYDEEHFVDIIEKVIKNHLPSNNYKINKAIKMNRLYEEFITDL